MSPRQKVIIAAVLVPLALLQVYFLWSGYVAWFVENFSYLFLYLAVVGILGVSFESLLAYFRIGGRIEERLLKIAGNNIIAAVFIAMYIAPSHYTALWLIGCVISDGLVFQTLQSTRWPRFGKISST